MDIDLSSLRGLSDDEARVRAALDGFNELPQSRKRSFAAIAFGVVREPMFLLLVACGVLYLFLGSLHEAIMLLCFVGVIISITLYQERKTERALEALRDLSSPRALVMRGGRQIRIAGRDVVRGDIIILAEGDRVPADAVVLSATSLSADESLLTGESAPVRKSAGSSGMEHVRPGGDDLPFVYSGTMIVQGQGIAEVTATGIGTELGKIGKALLDLVPEETRLQSEVRGLVKAVAIAGAVLCVVVIVVYALTRDGWMNGFLAGITLAMAMLPEEFPVVLTVFLALGAWRMSTKNVLTRRVPAIETLGSATVLCVDKTGTLTLNAMQVKKISARGMVHAVPSTAGELLPEWYHELMEYAVLASQRNPFDPMEKAIMRIAENGMFEAEHIHDDWKLIREYPLSRQMLAISHVWQSPDGNEYAVAVKGAPEAIADLCHFSDSDTERLKKDILSLSGEGLRVIGVARSSFNKGELPREQHDFAFTFLGLVAFEDPVRPSVPAAVKECYDAGMRIIMITGDYAGTAQNVARQAGFRMCDQVITGPDLEAMSDADLQSRLADCSIFARVVPEQKLRIVTALKARGDIVAMTGDGVNDAPALKAANIGIAMGARGTDVARESASLVLLDDDFTSIVRAVRMGRRIYWNLRKAMAYIFAIHIPIAGMSLLPVLFKWPLVLLPMHIVFLELIIDPACSVVFEAEPEEDDVMKLPPRPVKEPLFGFQTIILSVLQGTFVLLPILAVFVAALVRGASEPEARALAFTSLIFANLGLIVTNRSWSRTIIRVMSVRNTALWIVTAGALGFLGAVLYVPFLRELFRFSVLHPSDIALCACVGAVSILWFECFKAVAAFRRRRSSRTMY